MPAVYAPDALVARYLEVLVAHDPVDATKLGVTDADPCLPDVSDSGLDAYARALSTLMRDVEATRSVLTPSPERNDLTLLAQTLTYRHFHVSLRPRWQHDPLAALDTVMAGLATLLHTGRTQALVVRAQQVPAFLEMAAGQLETVPEPHREVALMRIPAMLTWLRHRAPRDLAARHQETFAAAAEALDAFAALVDEFGDEEPGPWRLGPAMHDVTLKTALGTTFDPQVIEDRARTLIATVREELYEFAGTNWAELFPGEQRETDVRQRLTRLFARLSDDPVTPNTLAAVLEETLQRTRAFSETLGFSRLPEPETLSTANVPAHLRGLAHAMYAPNPPLATRRGGVFHLDKDHTYDRHELMLLVIHEVYPGHFTQLEHAYRHPRTARRILSRPVFAEGWAVYAERLFAEHGFGEADASAFWLTQRKSELRIAMNALLDVGLHAGELDDAEALRLLEHTGFQSPQEARSKLLRAKITSGQLSSYFVGREELIDLRTSEQRRLGRLFVAEAFHQRLLSFGTPSFSVLRDEFHPAVFAVTARDTALPPRRLPN